jgi:hypothetical protein
VWEQKGREMHGRGRSGQSYVVKPSVIQSGPARRPMVAWDLDGGLYASTGEAMEHADAQEKALLEAPSSRRASR